MTGVGALFLFGGRSETIRGLRRDGRDERRQIDVHATALAGLAVIPAIIVAFIVELAGGTVARRTVGSARSAALPILLPSSTSQSAARSAAATHTPPWQHS
jgi:hypothetical protein